MNSPDPSEQQEFLLSQYLDGQLDDDARRRVEGRLRTDADLADSLEQLRQIDRLVRESAGPAPELDWERFTAQAAMRREAEADWRRRRRILRLYAPLAAAALVVLACTLYLTMGRSVSHEPLGPSFASVSIARADAWQDDPAVGEALAEVSFSRTGRALGAVQRASGGILVAAAGAGPPAGEPVVEETTPFF
ncbi:MAG: hypothetical protein IID40_07265 [Planctomycetes bacterium]|nr:hypothetical protein [Planctomycetota bacterium]